MLFERTDLRFEYLEFDAKRFYRCTRAANGDELTLETQSVTY